MALEVAMSIQQTTSDQFQKLIKEHAGNNAEIVKTMAEIFENPSLNTFTEFLHLKEIEEVRRGQLILCK